MFPHKFREDNDGSPQPLGSGSRRGRNERHNEKIPQKRISLVKKVYEEDKIGPYDTGLIKMKIKQIYQRALEKESIRKEQEEAEDKERLCKMCHIKKNDHGDQMFQHKFREDDLD